MLLNHWNHGALSKKGHTGTIPLPMRIGNMTSHQGWLSRNIAQEQAELRKIQQAHQMNGKVKQDIRGCDRMVFLRVD